MSAADIIAIVTTCGMYLCSIGTILYAIFFADRKPDDLRVIPRKAHKKK